VGCAEGTLISGSSRVDQERQGHRTVSGGAIGGLTASSSPSIAPGYPLTKLDPAMSGAAPRVLGGLLIGTAMLSTTLFFAAPIPML
jgi:hypothetical protein